METVSTPGPHGTSHSACWRLRTPSVSSAALALACVTPMRCSQCFSNVIADHADSFQYLLDHLGLGRAAEPIRQAFMAPAARLGMEEMLAGGGGGHHSCRGQLFQVLLP